MLNTPDTSRFFLSQHISQYPKWYLSTWRRQTPRHILSATLCPTEPKMAKDRK